MIKRWPKIARLTSPVIVTEKLDGTYGAVEIEKTDLDPVITDVDQPWFYEQVVDGDDYYIVRAHSKSRVLAPGKDDNFDFAQWVWDHALELVKLLGPGLHHGEWWGGGINRGYGLLKGDRNFSLFDFQNSFHLGQATSLNPQIPGLRVVPIIMSLDEIDGDSIDSVLHMLELTGSYAEVGFKPAEGVVVYNTYGMPIVKATLDNQPKSVLGEAKKAMQTAMERRAN